MTVQLAVFLLLAVATGFTAVMTVTSRNLIHAAVFLAVTLAGIGGVFLVLHADFVALVQIIVYVGAIAVLFLFGLMLTRAPIGREALDSQNRGLAFAVSLALFGVLSALIVESFGSAAAVPPDGPTVVDIGTAVFSSWVFPFELASMLLLAALVGAVLLARRSAGESGEEPEFTRVELGELPAVERDRPQLTEEAGEERPSLTRGGPS